jgi:hypothetical protein
MRYAYAMVKRFSNLLRVLRLGASTLLGKVCTKLRRKF